MASVSKWVVVAGGLFVDRVHRQNRGRGRASSHCAGLAMGPQLPRHRASSTAWRQHWRFLGQRIGSSCATCENGGINEARSRVIRFEKALEAIGDHSGPEVDRLKHALAKVRESAMELQGVYLAQREARWEIGGRGAVAAVGTECRQSVSHARRSQHGSRGHWSRVGASSSPSCRASGEYRHREASLSCQQCRLWCPPSCRKWMDDRQAELHEAMGSGDNRRVLMLTSKLSEAAQRMCEMTGST